MSRSVGSLALPITISILADSLLSVVALSTVSRLSTTAVAATGLASYLFFLVNALATVFTGGLMVVASQAIGAGEEGTAGRATGETITLSLIASAAFMLTASLWLPHYLAAVSSGNREVAAMALDYAVARLFSLPALMLNVSLSAAYRSADKPWPSAYSSVISVAAGSLLIPALTLGGPGIQAMGLKGAGIAMTLASYAGLVAYAVWRPPLKIVVARPSLLSLKVIALGAPTALERLVASIAQNIYISAVAKAGTEALAAHNIGITVEMLVIQPSFAISLAALVRAGQNTGSDSVEEAERSLKESIKVGASWMGLAALLLSLISPYVGPLFTSDPEVARLVQVYLLLAAASEVGLGVSSAVYGAVRGMGSVWLPLAINSFTVVFFRAIPAQVLADMYGALGAWVTQNTDIYGRALLALLAWKLLGARRLARKVV
ncbi:MATE family efflux transporter [Infirmifilum lucidum]|uniref:Multidrug-efflux transporter n=1 Tax=Infirmifilum lucidum TaxID=2776706 RepID=A0A7L9FG17_9CREN|nr:MATE family efflux transporter [Infirmifilum lucidum]QOJ78758.1 MATE family efflux transporter [Infirmifilum lucidum]